jgi:hypothetical protein
VTILVGTGRFLLAALIVFTESARGFDVVKSKIERDQDATPKVGHRRADQTKSSVRFAVTRFAAMAKETLRSTCVSLGRIVLKQPIARSVAGRLLNLHPHFKRRMIALVSGVPLSEVMSTATSIHLASMKSTDALSRTAMEALRLLKRQQDL